MSCVIYEVWTLLKETQKHYRCLNLNRGSQSHESAVFQPAENVNKLLKFLIPERRYKGNKLQTQIEREDMIYGAICENPFELIWCFFAESLLVKYRTRVNPGRFYYLLLLASAAGNGGVIKEMTGCFFLPQTSF